MQKDNRILTILVLIVFLITASCSESKTIFYMLSSSISPDRDNIFHDFHKQPTVNIEDFNHNGKLYYLCKVWGFIKYHDEALDTKILNWNQVLLRNIPEVIAAQNPDEFRQVINNMLQNIKQGDIVKKSVKQRNMRLLRYNQANLDWAKNNTYLNSEISHLLSEMLLNRKGIASPYIKNSRSGNLRFPNEKDYDTTFYPSHEQRLFGLFNYWNAINYFYVNKNIMDQSWDSVLIEMIPHFYHAKDSFDYNLAVVKLISKLNDGHSIVHSTIIDEVVYPVNVPTFRLRRINDTFYIKKRQVQNGDNQVYNGDILLRVNEKPAGEIYDSIAQLRGFSNLEAAQVEVNPYMVLTSEDSIHIRIQRNEDEIDINTPSRHWQQMRKEEKTFCDSNRAKPLIYPTSDVAYINLKTFNRKHFSELNKVKKYNKVIIDVRAYPKSKVTLELIDFFTPSGKRFAKIRYSDVRYPGISRVTGSFKILPKTYTYSGNIILLVDENTQSEAEYLVMALQQAKNVITVGSRTAGADGNITFFRFPGKIKSSFSGLSIYYPDLRPTQRVGIHIDHWVENSVDDFKNDKDAVLEYALQLFNKT